jgi:hypothetical protein
MFLIHSVVTSLELHYKAQCIIIIIIIIIITYLLPINGAGCCLLMMLRTSCRGVSIFNL